MRIPITDWFSAAFATAIFSLLSLALISLGFGGDVLPVVQHLPVLQFLLVALSGGLAGAISHSLIRGYNSKIYSYRKQRTSTRYFLAPNVLRFLAIGIYLIANVTLVLLEDLKGGPGSATEPSLIILWGILTIWCLFSSWQLRCFFLTH